MDLFQEQFLPICRRKLTRRRKLELRSASGRGVARYLPFLLAEQAGEIEQLPSPRLIVLQAFAAECRLHVEKRFIPASKLFVTSDSEPLVVVEFSHENAFVSGHELRNGMSFNVVRTSPGFFLFLFLFLPQVIITRS